MSAVTSEIRTGLFIAGEARPGEDHFPVYDPADSSQVIGHAAKATTEQAKAAVRAARAAFPAWSALTPHERAELILAALEPLAADHDDRALLLSRENGKTVFESSLDIQVLGARFHLAAGLADQLAEPKTIEGKPLPQAPLSFHTTVERVAIGVVSIIVPFNWPLAILGASLPYALVAGNTTIVKAPPTTPLSFVRTLEIIAAQLPPGVLNVVSGTDDVLGPVLIQDPDVNKISFTGSVRAGKLIAGMAAEGLKRVSLELGGNDPAVFLEDADLGGDAFHRIDLGAFLTTGQVCMAAKRVYVHESRYDELVEGLSAELAKHRLGRGQAEGTTMGPLNSARQKEIVEELVADARANGAEVREFGEGDEAELAKGNFLKPSIVLKPAQDSRIVQEEQFGPTLPIVTFKTDEEAIALANDTWSGLASSVWSADLEHANAVAAQLRAGTTWINAHNAPWLDERAPFGGFNQSGIGREMGVEGLFGFTETHSTMRTAG
ncbi:MAG TPA: aldehyde dehydrogenase family protein [Solirubrobacteraceae bacterium]|jgi:acyl-CoA reductase-like NAD-dependent aldehyde dehydrogenase|nr:aldehyde dehydrogenase family protein [Solirubrobacteraceae bacterium]